MKPKLITIAGESGKYTAVALDCIAASCCVMIEKPISLSITDADAIVEAEKKAGMVVCVQQSEFLYVIKDVSENWAKTSLDVGYTTAQNELSEQNMQKYGKLVLIANQQQKY